jgi:hypothetical protein
MEEEQDRKWAEDHNDHTKNEGQKWGAQGEDRASEITSWRIERIKENN